MESSGIRVPKVSWIALRCMALAAILFAPAAAGEPLPEFPVIREISFEGNDTTQPKTMLREMVIQSGDPADPVAIERSRQGVQDLGLFRSVRVRQEPVEGGVRLVFTVKEKYYILPLPSASANSDGGYSYGFRTRWYNIWGLNHSLLAYYQKRQSSEGTADPVKTGVQTRYQLRYSAPFIADSPFSLNLALGRGITPYVKPLVYDSIMDFASVSLSRKLSERVDSQGWEISAGMDWERQHSAGPDAPPDQGRATSLSAGLSYRDLRDHLYSYEGIAYGFSAGTASRDVLSDYTSTDWSANFADYLQVGETPHQTLNLFISGAGSQGGAPGREAAYSLGGVDSLRGYEPETVKGDSYYLFSAEFLRPVLRNSIRALAVVDAGTMVEEGGPADQPGSEHIGNVLVSAGAGMRIRVQAFVNLEFEIGVAWPLNGGAPRFFASKI